MKVEIYLLRHGIAEDGGAGQPDSARALTPEGRKKLRGVLRVARSAGVAPALILTSPFKRAVQTAHLAAELLEHKGELLRTQALIPGSTPESVWDEIRAHKDAAQTLLAGHEPLFSHLAGYLLGCPNLRIDFKKGALVRIDVDGFGPHPRGVLKWVLAPKLALKGAGPENG